MQNSAAEESYPDSSTAVSIFSPDSEIPLLTSANHQEQSTQASIANKFVFPVHYGIKFVAGKFEFGLTAPPAELLYTLWMFDAAKRGDLNELRYIVESSKSEELVTPYVAVTQPENNNNRLSTISVSSNRGVDVNMEYQKPAYSDDAFLGGNFSRRRSSVRNVSLLSPLLSPGASSAAVGGGACVNALQEHKLLLHIAIEKNLLDMVAYLLTQNADV